MQATVIPLALCDSIPATVTVRDLSRAGIGILSPQSLALDQQFVLLLPQADDSPALVLCAVAFWQPVVRGTFAIGGSLRPDSPRFDRGVAHQYARRDAGYVAQIPVATLRLTAVMRLRPEVVRVFNPCKVRESSKIAILSQSAPAQHGLKTRATTVRLRVSYGLSAWSMLFMRSRVRLMSCR